MPPRKQHQTPAPGRDSSGSTTPTPSRIRENRVGRVRQKRTENRDKKNTAEHASKEADVKSSLNPNSEGHDPQNMDPTSFTRLPRETFGTDSQIQRARGSRSKKPQNKLYVYPPSKGQYKTRQTPSKQKTTVSDLKLADEADAKLAPLVKDWLKQDISNDHWSTCIIDSRKYPSHESHPRAVAARRKLEELSKILDGLPEADEEYEFSFAP